MLNWLTRYAFVTAELERDGDGSLRESVLDVGCGPHGLSSALPGVAFAGVDVSFPAPIAPGMIGFRNEPGPLPFVDGAFDTVVCLDVLEHVPPAERAGFVRELARVAARRVLVACPSDEGAWIDDLLRSTYAARGIPAPGWLSEHDEHGLPTAAEIAAFCAGPEGFAARELTMTNGLVSTLAVMADMLPEFAERAAAEYRDAGAEWLSLFAGARFGSCYRKGYAVQREVPLSARVNWGRFEGTIWAAVRCPACGKAECGPTGGAPACRACGHTLGRDLSGAVDLTRCPAPVVASTQAVVAPAPAAPAVVAPAPPPLPPLATLPAAVARPPAAAASVAPVRSSAERRLLLAPDWDQPRTWLPALARYVAGADPDGSSVLCIDAVDSGLGLAAVHEMLSLACEAVSGGRPFADVLVLDEPYAHEGLRAVASADELAASLELGPLSRPVDPDDTARQAREAKTLHDAVRAVAERRRFELAADPWSEREPLVSVRIPTWNGHRLLVERAIPSALNGTYGNVEVVVCSDGPDPEARAAVESVGDPRVRYLELPERPVYPGQPWSFWETAGIHAVNRALEACAGAFIAPLDHDDAFTDDHIHALLAAAAGASADLVYGQALMQEGNATWRTCGSAPLAHGQIAHGSALYSRRLAHLRMDADCWLHGEPGDWNMWRRMREVGASIGFVPRVVLAHFKERSSIESRADADADAGLARMTRTAAELAEDVERTGLEWLLEIPLPVSAAV